MTIIHERPTHHSSAFVCEDLTANNDLAFDAGIALFEGAPATQLETELTIVPSLLAQGGRPSRLAGRVCSGTPLSSFALRLTAILL